MRLGTRSRSGYTFLEVTLALGLALILISGVYSAVQMTYQQWEVGRQAADEAQLVRALFQRLRIDVQATMVNWTPPQAPAQTPGATATGATVAGATGATASSTGSTTTSGSSTSSSAAATPSNNPTNFPDGGVVGGPDHLSLVIRAAPSDLDFSPNLAQGTNPSVLRTVTYSVGQVQQSGAIDDGETGLLREKSPRMPDAISPDGHSSDTRMELLAPEIKQVRFMYYDGLYWTDAWDLLESGPPVCVQVEVGLKVNSYKNINSNDGLRWYQALITFPAPPAEPSESSSESSGATATGAGAASTATGATTTGAGGAGS